ncbi:MAG TPA: DNA polymerase III subunit alpha [bacterium]|nr:DNA polymerase III subunit alpha [bacterium]
MNGVRLGLRSAYSLLYGTRSPADICERAAAYGARAIAITDRGNLYGLHSIVEAARDTGLKPIIGAELGAGSGQGSGGRVFVFVRDRAGFARLCECLSASSAAKEADATAGFDLVQALRDDSGGLVLASDSPEIIGALAGRVPNLFAAVTPSSVTAVREARRLGVPLVAIDDATFLDPEDRATHEVLRAMALGKTVGTIVASDLAPGGPDGGLFLTAEELERRLVSWPDALAATSKIAALCPFDTVFDGFVFPEYKSGDDDPGTVLRARVMDGAERRYGELSDGIIGRIDYELDIIGRKGFAPYFLVMDDIVAMSSRTCGRGSGAASIVAYALGITNVDPIAYNLYFERFLTMSRPDPPDIDVDFAWDERPALMRRVIERFGADRCARVANHTMFRPRSAFREVAKAYGFSDSEISRREHRLEAQGSAPDDVDPPWDEILAIARRMTGLPRGLSMHCGGLVIAPGPLRRYAPVERSAEGFPLLAWEKDGAEAAGLVKLDLLGNRSLAVIRDALANLREEGIDIDEALWRPAEDAQTVAALARGDSMGVFYIESPAMRQLQRKTGAGDFDHIVIHSSIIRPAANKLISEYVRRLKGAPWQPLHPRLAGILDETLGIVCYQEDVSKVAIALAGFNEDQADRLRKVISKKAGEAKLAEYRDRFFAGCDRNGVDMATTQTAWDMLLSFDGYSFCKPHSASYAMVSFQSAWLRVHHPAAFMAAVLANQGGYYRPHAYISEARRMGLKVAGPDVNTSLWAYRGQADTVLVGLSAIAGLSRTAADSIVDERGRGGPYADLADFSLRMRPHLCRPARDDLVALVAAGAFDSLAPSDSRSAQIRALLCAEPVAFPPAAAAQTAGTAIQGELFAPAERPGPPHGRPAAAMQTARPRNTEKELRDEFEALGFLRDRHPLALWGQAIARVRRIKARDIPMHVGRRVTLIGWPITQKEVFTSGGLVMDFVSLEDETALYETVLFPEAYTRWRHMLFSPQPLIVSGLVCDDQGALSIQVSTLAPLDAPVSMIDGK